MVILTRQNVIPYLNKVTVAEITSRGKEYPTETCINQQANLEKASFVQADNLHTIPRDRLQKRLGTLSQETMAHVSRKIVLALVLEDSLTDIQEYGRL